MVDVPSLGRRGGTNTPTLAGRADSVSGEAGELMSGWLVKSPPSLDSKKPIFNPKWRRRWFVLREGGVPGQYILSYYTDPTTKKLKGSIDLDQCYQVDSGLTYNSGKCSLTNLFNISTQKRIYYLSADTVEEMNSWVQSLCQACGLRAYQTDEDKDEVLTNTDLYNESSMRRKESSMSEGEGGSLASTPRGGTHTIISGPYMHLADCFTGGGPPSTLRSSNKTHFSSGISSADISLTCGEDSVFLPNSPSGNLPRNHSFEQSIPQLQGVHPVPPSRPPKPSGLRTNSTGHPSKSCGDNYENLSTAQSMQSNRTNQRNLPSSSMSSSVSTPHIYDDSGPPPPTHPPPQAPDGHGGSGGSFPPPQIDRRLKPGRDGVGVHTAGHPTGERKQSAPSSDTMRTSSTITNQFDTFRSVHTVNQFDTLDARQVGRTSSLESVDSRRNSAEETIYYYMPSLQPSGQGTGNWDPIMIPAQDMIGHSIEYLDLDLPSEKSTESSKETKKEAESPNTVYKTVDFLKTEAFNKTKKKVEDQKYNIHSS